MGIVERVRSLAEKNGHTIASVERELGFGQGSIRNWNKAAPSADKLYKVAKLFNVSMEYILTGEGQAAEKDADAIRGISDDALKVGCLWDGLDEAGKACFNNKVKFSAGRWLPMPSLANSFARQSDVPGLLAGAAAIIA